MPLKDPEYLSTFASTFVNTARWFNSKNKHHHILSYLNWLVLPAAADYILSLSLSPAQRPCNFLKILFPDKFKFLFLSDSIYRQVIQNIFYNIYNVYKYIIYISMKNLR